ncbi:MAG TPA: hypothetical protein VGG71_13500 [Chitinophagaceae bacterium]|jgi:hypothetical protein
MKNYILFKFYCFLVFIVFGWFNALASDTTYKKSPWFLSLNIGYGSNTVKGSMVDFAKQNNVIEQKDTWGMLFNITVTKNLSGIYYLKTGLGYARKNVNPEENSGLVYKDSLCTNYLTIPVNVGIELPMSKKRDVFFVVETGLLGNICLADKSYTGPQTVSLDAKPFVLAFQASGGFEFAVAPKVSFLIQYLFSTDISNAYAETHDVGAYNSTYYYKYNTNAFTLSLKYLL